MNISLKVPVATVMAAAAMAAIPAIAPSATGFAPTSAHASLSEFSKCYTGEGRLAMKKAGKCSWDEEVIAFHKCKKFLPGG